MHERTLLAGLVRTVERLALEQGACRVSGVDVTLGALSHFSPEHFREHWHEVAAGTVAAEAELRILVEPSVEHPHAQEVILNSMDLQFDPEDPDPTIEGATGVPFLPAAPGEAARNGPASRR
jgi:hydrogenase nickel incorporation protein HypA/HybF